jgi:hypothetical protein
VTFLGVALGGASAVWHRLKRYRVSRAAVDVTGVLRTEEDE